MDDENKQTRKITLPDGSEINVHVITSDVDIPEGMDMDKLIADVIQGQKDKHDRSKEPMPIVEHRIITETDKLASHILSVGSKVLMYVHWDPQHVRIDFSNCVGKDLREFGENIFHLGDEQNIIADNKTSSERADEAEAEGSTVTCSLVVHNIAGNDEQLLTVWMSNGAHAMAPMDENYEGTFDMSILIGRKFKEVDAVVRTFAGDSFDDDEEEDED